MCFRPWQASFVYNGRHAALFPYHPRWHIFVNKCEPFTAVRNSLLSKGVEVHDLVRTKALDRADARRGTD